MSWFDEPALYYRPDRPLDWSLGDLVVAPQAALWAGEASDALTTAPALGQRTRRALWRAGPAAPAVSAEAGWDLAMVVLDDCALDRDFNRELSRRERELRAAGVEAAAAHGQAEAAARAVEGLDPTLVVARVRPYSDFEPSRHDALRRADTFGYFPVLGTDDVDEGVVDFSLVTTKLSMCPRTIPLGASATIPGPWDRAPAPVLRSMAPRAFGEPLATSTSAAAGPISTGGVAGLARALACGAPCEPPDPWVAVGSSDIVQAVNLSVRISTRAGVPLSTVPFASFFAEPPSQVRDADPRALWDPSHGRWLASELSYDCAAGHLYLAVRLDPIQRSAGRSTGSTSRATFLTTRASATPATRWSWGRTRTRSRRAAGAARWRRAHPGRSSTSSTGRPSSLADR